MLGTHQSTEKREELFSLAKRNNPLKLSGVTERRTTSYLEIIRRFLTVLAVALWFGGFTFYALVVIHTGHKVFGGIRQTGFLTQQVTHWLNLIGVAALLILLWNVAAGWSYAKPAARWGLVLTWFTMAALEIALFALHPQLDKLLDSQAQTILDRGRFVSLHQLYMNLSTGQWGATFLHIWLVLRVWMRCDKTLARIMTMEGDVAQSAK